jgi:inosine-uridine nucleoside N-ribohydrolase
MEKSYLEILKIVNLFGKESDGFVFRGSTGFIKDHDHPFRSEAALDLVERAMERSGEPLYVVAVGAITNIASAILIEPRIIENIVVVWLGGHATTWPNTREFNLRQDILSARLLLDCGVPFVRIPTRPVTSHLQTTLPEIEHYVKGKGKIGDYLAGIFAEYQSGYAKSKVIWDISAIAYLINPDWVPTDIVSSPILTDQLTWSVDGSRHFIRTATSVNRDAIFGDLFGKLK